MHADSPGPSFIAIAEVATLACHSRERGNPVPTPASAGVTGARLSQVPPQPFRMLRVLFLDPYFSRNQKKISNLLKIIYN